MTNQSISQRPAASALKDDDLIPISQKQANGSYLTCKVPADKLKGASAYQQWFNYNTSENTYLTMQSIYQLQQVSSYNTVNNFVTATNLTSTYNSWVENDYEVQNNYLTENNLLEAFTTYNSEVNNVTFMDFIEENNLTNNYNSWLVTNKTELQTLFMQVTNATVVYNSYVAAHPNSTLQEFLAAIGAEDGFNDWLEDRVAKLTEEAFNSMLAGKNAKAATVSKYEKFWISICGLYAPAPDDPESGPSIPGQFDLLINSIVLPTDIFFEQHQIHQIQKLSAEAPAITMVSNTGFYIRNVGHYTEDGVHSEDPVLLEINDDNELVPFNMLGAGQRLYVKAGSTLAFGWAEKPEEETAVSLTLVAKKRVEADSDTATVKLSGWFLIHDSINGWVSDDSGSRTILSLSQFAFYSDAFRFEDSFLSNFFYADFSAVATGYDPVFYQHGTAVIKNMSDVPRVLTLVPFNQGAGFISSIDENPNDLPPNIQIRNGALVLDLSANQD